MTISRFSLPAFGAPALLLAGCGGEQPAPAPSPSPMVTTTPAAATSQGGRLAAAVAAAFPDGAVAQDENGDRFVFAEHKLIDTPFGPVLASEGRVQDPSHVSAGRIDLAYLTPAGANFTVARRFPAAVVNGSFGQMSGWQLRADLAAVPTIAAEGGFTGQGYSCGNIVLTELQSNGPVEVGTIRTLYDNSGVAKGDAVRSFEGTIANPTPVGFDVAFTGTRSFTEHYVRRAGKWVRQGPGELPEC
jgi:hypothetical protein